MRRRERRFRITDGGTLKDGKNPGSDGKMRRGRREDREGEKRLGTTTRVKKRRLKDLLKASAADGVLSIKRKQ